MKRYRRRAVCASCERPLTLRQELSGCCPYCGELAVGSCVQTKTKAIRTDYGPALLIAGFAVVLGVFIAAVNLLGG